MEPECVELDKCISRRALILDSAHRHIEAQSSAKVHGIVALCWFFLAKLESRDHMRPWELVDRICWAQLSHQKCHTINLSQPSSGWVVTHTHKQTNKHTHTHILFIALRSRQIPVACMPNQPKTPNVLEQLILSLNCLNLFQFTHDGCLQQIANENVLDMLDVTWSYVHDSLAIIVIPAALRS